MHLAKLDKSRLVGRAELLDLLFTDSTSRPCLRTLHNWTKARKITSYKIGKGVWYDPDEVRAELEKEKQKTRPMIELPDGYHPPLCLNCVHILLDERNADLSLCGRSARVFNPISGQERRRFCDNEREPHGDCRPEARHFQPKTENPT